MSTTIFVYGTLKPSLAPAVVRSAVDTFQPLGPATVRGVLYDLGRYPGVVLGYKGVVHGDLFALPEDAGELAAVIRRLDRYEGYDVERPAHSAFVREVTTARLPDGRWSDASIYVYTRPVTAAQRIDSGRWEPPAK